MLYIRNLVTCSLLCVATALISSANAQTRTGGYESHRGPQPTTGSGSAGQRSGTSSGENPAAMMQRHLDQNARDQDAQARQRDADELKRLQDENNRLREAERQQQRNAGASGGRAGAQPSSGNDGDDPDGGSGSGSQNASFQPLNPDGNHEGKACAYFTKPAIREDGGGLNYYGDGAYVVYGKWMYRCEHRRWKNTGPASVHPKSEVDRLKAEKQESSSLKSGAYFSKD